MNWDTREISMVVENDPRYFEVLRSRIENELSFLTALYVIIIGYNERNERSRQIDSSKVNGNEVYVSFSQAVGNEQEGWK